MGRPSGPAAPAASGIALSEGGEKLLHQRTEGWAAGEWMTPSWPSPSTVDTHVRSIYAELRVRDRSAAVQRAPELRLLAAVRPRSPAVT